MLGLASQATEAPTRLLELARTLPGLHLPTLATSAAVLVLPILTLYADLFAILGGLFVGVVGLDLTAYTYIRQTLQGLHMSDIATSLVKSGVFAVLIAGISCQRGFQVTGAAEAVGRQTTSAVVSALFLVIVADSLFAIVLHYI